ncbi:phage head closure protein [Devosia sp. 2618]|uniref:phage head closure protein n=1 Tax=Devosia sp. 2618 TaxID=3156454 RepID=UPI003392AF1D
MGVSAGKLDRRIVLRRPSLTRDAQNRPITTWDTVGPVWASWRRATANERLASAQVTAQVTDIFEVHWSSRVKDIDPSCEVEFRGTVYDLVEATEIGYREGMLIRANARVDQP